MRWLFNPYPQNPRPDLVFLSSVGGSQYHARFGPGLGTWPVFLEKALTAFDAKRNFDPHHANYMRTEEGKGGEGLALLLGVDTATHYVSPPAVTGSAPAELEFNRNMMMLFNGAFDPKQPEEWAALQKIFGPGQALQHWQRWLEWLEWLNKVQPVDLSAELTAVASARQQKARIVWKKGKNIWNSDTQETRGGGTFRVEHFMAWFDQWSGLLSIPVRAAVTSYVRTCGALAGKRGTGVYSQSQIQTFNYMLALYQGNCPMTAATRSYIGSSGSLIQYHDDEVKGLLPDHAYAVTRVHRSGNLCLIRLINPWGWRGRRLITGVPDTRPNAHLRSTPVAPTDEAEFDLDLDDFTKRFDNVCHTKGPLRPLGS